MLMTVWVMLGALVLDYMLGEPRCFHPLVGFGRYAATLERCLNHSGMGRLRGLAAWLLAVGPFLALAMGLGWLDAPLRYLLDGVILYLAVGMRSLSEHAMRVQFALADGDLLKARRYVGEIVSRDTACMESEDVARAGVESVLENGNDAVFAALFWFALLGAPGALLYRLANTLDAMWGYRTPRYCCFGWAAARIDDALNFIPARITALTYAMLSNARDAWECWQTQACQWDSPNAGPVMASGAGGLNVCLGGSAMYHGTLEQRPVLGKGRMPQADDIGRAVRLVTRGVWLWLVVLLVIGAAYA